MARQSWPLDAIWQTDERKSSDVGGQLSRAAVPVLSEATAADVESEGVVAAPRGMTNTSSATSVPSATKPASVPARRASIVSPIRLFGPLFGDEPVQRKSCVGRPILPPSGLCQLVVNAIPAMDGMPFASPLRRRPVTARQKRVRRDTSRATRMRRSHKGGLRAEPARWSLARVSGPTLLGGLDGGKCHSSQSPRSCGDEPRRSESGCPRAPRRNLFEADLQDQLGGVVTRHEHGPHRATGLTTSAQAYEPRPRRVSCGSSRVATSGGTKRDDDHGSSRRRWPGWLARKDSNLQSPDPESGALPLGHSPARGQVYARRPLPPARRIRRLASTSSSDLSTSFQRVAPDARLSS